MVMPSRQYVAGTSYRYGFNGKEYDNELKSGENSYDFGARMMDPRLGRFFTTDPLDKRYPFQSTYVFAGDRPIASVDIMGMGEGKAPVKRQTTSSNSTNYSNPVPPSPSLYGYTPSASNSQNPFFPSLTPQQPTAPQKPQTNGKQLVTTTYTYESSKKTVAGPYESPVGDYYEQDMKLTYQNGKQGELNVNFTMDEEMKTSTDISANQDIGPFKIRQTIKSDGEMGISIGVNDWRTGFAMTKDLKFKFSVTNRQDQGEGYKTTTTLRPGGVAGGGVVGLVLICVFAPELAPAVSRYITTLVQKVPTMAPSP
jgi:RHS repeat-associated protein